MSVTFHLALDSGAHSLFTKYIQRSQSLANVNLSVRVNQKKTFDLSFIRHKGKYTKKFMTYFDKYVTYLHEVQDKLEFFITLDVIHQPELSYDVTRMLEKEDLRSMPVVHYGTDLSWLKRYMDRGYEYIAFGGLGQATTMQNYISDPWAHNAFKLVSNSKGVPQWKIHGLAMSHIELIDKFPWYSIDSSTSFYCAHVGELCVPTRTDPSRPGQLVYRKIPITTNRYDSRRHYLRMSRSQQRVVDEQIERLGLTMAELAAGKNYTLREVANLMLFNQVAAELDIPLKLYAAGSISSFDSKKNSFHDLIQRGMFEKGGVKDVYYLGTFYQKRITDWFLNKGLYTNGRDNENSRPRLRTKTRPTLHHAD